MKRVILSVTNDLATDQRVNRVCLTLLTLGFEVWVVGRKLPGSLPLEKQAYKSKRMQLLFTSGPLFYLEYTIRLFLFLLFHKSDVLVANDLDTLAPNYFAARLKRCELVYDSHEYFTEVPELQHSPFKKRIWKSIEGFIFPKLNHIFTVNESIASIYKKEYKKEVSVVRNIPIRKSFSSYRTKKELGIPENKKILVLQGAGINIQRGAEEAVEAMRSVENSILFIIGSGDVLPALKETVRKTGLEERVKFIGKLPYDDLLQFTHHADLGLSLDKDLSLNYRYSLPNKLFDYIFSGVPVLASPLPEVKKIILQYALGDCIENHDPLHIASKINSVLGNTELMQKWKENTKLAAASLSWENEEKELIRVYSQLGE